MAAPEEPQHDKGGVVDWKTFVLVSVQAVRESYDLQFKSLREHVDQGFHLRDKALDAALAAAKEAVQKAEENSEKWRANANEWRAAMNDREARAVEKDKDFVSRVEYEQWKKSISLSSVLGFVVGLLGILAATISLVYKLR